MIVPNAEYHHVWRKDDVVIWDNRCSDHKAAGDYPPEEIAFIGACRSMIAAAAHGQSIKDMNGNFL